MLSAAGQAAFKPMAELVSPPWLTETLQATGRPLEGSLPAAVVARAYVRSVEGEETGL